MPQNRLNISQLSRHTESAAAAKIAAQQETFESTNIKVYV